MGVTNRQLGQFVIELVVVLSLVIGFLALAHELTHQFLDSMKHQQGKATHVD
ncbi:MAG: hypothetical protein IT289_03080 [Oligoflexia bacterium]|nr:hypothetical protein [Oligoflexia bacterium]